MMRALFRNTLVLAFSLVAIGLSAPPVTADSCVACHDNQDFLVTNKKLYDYFQDWRASTHGQEDVTCVDCHGGNPKAKDKKAAHGKSILTKASNSAVSFKNIPSTCGDCHDEMAASYKKSKHFDHLVKKKQDDQGPNCVTCHGSVTAKALNVNSVRDTCAKCHNKKSDNHPDIPLKAEVLLNDLNTIRAYNRYIGIRGSGDTRDKALGVIGPKLDGLGVIWHTFDLDKISQETDMLLDYSRDKRNEVKKNRKKSNKKTQ